MKAFDPGWAHHETSNPLLRPLKGVLHLQWLSLRLTQYFKSLDRTVGPVPCPDPLDIVNKVQIQEKWEPNLSTTFYDRYGLRSFLRFHSGFKDDGTAATDMSSLSGGTSLGTGTRNGPPTGGSEDTKATNTRLDNTHFNNALFGTYKSTSVKSAVLRKKVAAGTIGPLPMSKVDSTMPMCLAWHTKGLCNSRRHFPVWNFPQNQSLPTVHSSVQQLVKRKAPPPACLPSKRGSFDLAQLPSDLGELIAHDTALLQRLGWRGLVAHRRPSSDFASLDNLHHPARRLLRLYAHRGAPVKFATPPWNRQHLQRALSRGPHCSSLEYIDFLQEEFVDMINKGQWVILPAKAVLHLPGL